MAPPDDSDVIDHHCVVVCYTFLLVIFEVLQCLLHVEEVLVEAELSVERCIRVLQAEQSRYNPHDVIINMTS